MGWDGTRTTIGQSQQAVCTASANPTSTTNVTVPGMSITVTVASTNDVWMVDLDIDLTMGGTASLVNIIELLVDGAAQTPQIRTTMPATISAPHKRFRVTGLSPGSHTFTVRTRNSAAGPAQVNSSNSLITVEQTS